MHSKVASAEPLCTEPCYIILLVVIAQVEIHPEDQHDEIRQYRDTRYISPVEACWRLFEFETHHLSTHVEHLSIHLEHQQSVTFHTNQPLDEVRTVRTESTKKIRYI